MPARQVRVQGLRSLTAANGGTAVTGLVTFGLLPGTQYVKIHSRAFTTAVGLQYALNPYLAVLKTTDAGATWTDYSSAAQDEDAATHVDLSGLSTLANGDAVYIGAATAFRGLDVDVDGPNGNSSVLTASYWNGSAWVDTSDTDGTISTGKTLGQDGTIAWTVPSAWSAGSLNNILQNLDGGGSFQSTATAAPQYGYQSLFWVRLEVGAALDSAVTLDSIHALAGSTAYAELTAGDDVIELAANHGEFGSVELTVTTGTVNTVVTVGGNFA
jgi:hypothetical protein